LGQACKADDRMWGGNENFKFPFALLVSSGSAE